MPGVPGRLPDVSGEVRVLPAEQAELFAIVDSTKKDIVRPAGEPSLASR